MDWTIERVDGLAWKREGLGDPGDKKDFFAPGGRCNPLKRLKTDKEIQGNPSLFL